MVEGLLNDLIAGNSCEFGNEVECLVTRNGCIDWRNDLKFENHLADSRHEEDDRSA